jgi:flagellar protein FliS
MSFAHAAAAYRQVGVTSRSLEHNPHELIAQLLAGAIERIRRARTLAQRGERGPKSEAIRGAAAIVDALRLALDQRRGGALAEQLDALYEYVGRRLVEANAADDIARLDECEQLLGGIDSAWAQIGPPGNAP